MLKCDQGSMSPITSEVGNKGALSSQAEMVCPDFTLCACDIS